MTTVFAQINRTDAQQVEAEGKVYREWMSFDSSVEPVEAIKAYCEGLAKVAGIKDPEIIIEIPEPLV